MRSGSNTRVSEKFFVVLSFLSKSCNRKNRKLIGIFKEAILSSRWRYIGKIRVVLEYRKNSKENRGVSLCFIPIILKYPGAFFQNLKDTAFKEHVK